MNRYQGALTAVEALGMERALRRLRRITPWGVDDDDLRQEAAIKLWQTRATRKPTFGSAYQQSCWAIIDHLRVHGFSKAGVGFAQVDSEDEAPPSIAPDDTMRSAMAREAVQALIHRCTPSVHRAVEAVLEHGDHAAAAAHLGICSTRVCQLMRKARERVETAI